MWEEASKALKKDKYIGPMISKYGPCEIKPKKESDYFKSLVRAIAGQQLSVKAAATIFGRVEAKLINTTPESVLKIQDQYLRDCGLSWAKIKYVKDIAKRTYDGRLKTKSFNKLSQEEIMRELVVVKGVGKWTAEMFLMFTLGFPDIFPVDDLGIRNGMKKLLGKELSNVEMEKFAERWKPYRTFASWYIWEMLDNK